MHSVIQNAETSPTFHLKLVDVLVNFPLAFMKEGRKTGRQVGRQAGRKGGRKEETEEEKRVREGKTEC